jgi:hypothetical protein
LLKDILAGIRSGVMRRQELDAFIRFALKTLPSAPRQRKRLALFL